MPDPRPAELDPVHILAICARASGRRVLAVRKAQGIVVCVLPSQRTAYRSSTALMRVGYEVTSVSADRGRSLLVTGWDPAALDSRLATMRAVLHQLAGNPPLTAQAVIGHFRALPTQSRTEQQQWELLNQARIGLRGWVTSRSGIHALSSSVIQPSDADLARRLRVAGRLEQGIDDQVQRQLRVAGYALALFRRLSEQTNGDAAEDTAIRWASITFHLSSPTAAGSPGRLGPAQRIAAEFPCAALAADRPINVVSLDPARRRARPGPIPRLNP